MPPELRAIDALRSVGRDGGSDVALNADARPYHTESASR